MSTARAYLSLGQLYWRVRVFCFHAGVDTGIRRVQCISYMPPPRPSMSHFPVPQSVHGLCMANVERWVASTHFGGFSKFTSTEHFVLHLELKIMRTMTKINTVYLKAHKFEFTPAQINFELHDLWIAACSLKSPAHVETY